MNAASFPDPILWSNYPEAWIKGSFNTYFVNSLIYSVTIVFGSLIIATLAAFPIARGHLRWSNGFYILFLVFTVLGSVVTATNVLEFGDVMILLMAFPNILGLYFLGGMVKSELAEYEQMRREGRFQAYK